MSWHGTCTVRIAALMLPMEIVMDYELETWELDEVIDIRTLALGVDHE